MRVRTRREGIASNLTASESFYDLTYALIKEEEQRNNSRDVNPTAIHYNIRRASRTAVLLQHMNRSHPETTPISNTDVGGQSKSEIHYAFMSAADELDRHAAFKQLYDVVAEVFQWHGVSTPPSGVNNRRNMSLVTTQVARELPARWVMQSLNDTTEVHSTRGSVTLLDCGATVFLRGDDDGHNNGDGKENAPAGDATLYRVVNMADMLGQEYWVDIEAVGAPTPMTPSITSSPGRVRRVDRDAVVLHPPQPLFFDALLPADEMYNTRGTSTCIFLTAILAVRGLLPSRQVRRGIRAARSTELQQDEEEEVGKVLKDLPKRIAVRMSLAARDIRKQLHTQRLARRISCLGSPMTGMVEVHMERDCVVLRYGGELVELLPRALQRLALLWDARIRREARERGIVLGGENTARAEELWRNAAAQRTSMIFTTPRTAKRTVKGEEEEKDVECVFSTQEPFFVRAFSMLLRYRTFFGDLGYNQGPHAAVPPRVLHQLHLAFDVQCEAFASPLNAQLPRFASLFPDTDYYFGSMGAFFDLSLVSGHYEVNPPFVTAVLQRLQKLLLCDTLPHHNSEDAASMLFVLVLPSHDLDEAERNVSTAAPAQTSSRVERDGSNEGTSAMGMGCRFSRKQNRMKDKSVGDAPINDDDNSNKVNEGSGSVERALRESSFCIAHMLCSASESAYVDGHQHVLRSPLFCINSPTRLIVLGNCTARRSYGDAAVRLATVRDAWSRYTLDSRENDNNVNE